MKTIRKTLQILVIAVAALLACSSVRDAPGASATPLEATGILFARDVATDSGLDASVEWGGVVYTPVCAAVAVGPNELLTVAHCGERFPLWFESYRDFETTASGGMLLVSDLGSTGNVMHLAPGGPLDAWLITHAAATDGPAAVSMLLGTHLQDVDTVLTGARFSAQVQHGNSGSPITQDGALVGLVETCVAPNPDDGVTCLPGGGFDAVQAE